MDSTAVPQITLNQLESHIWEAADILRGPLDAADFKDVEHLARVAPINEISTNDHNLNISLYVQPKDDQPVITVE